ncbi:MAG: 3-dehydroquinate synthase [Candidatus Obscuribacterales bacterium]|nr:3-dehydroquinate synthase [Candidatus Obscuribacterales bacterium]
MKKHSRPGQEDSASTLLLQSSLELKSRVDIVEGGRLRLGRILRQLNVGRKVLLLSQETLPSAWFEDCKAALTAENFEQYSLSLPEGEAAKSIEQLCRIWEFLQKNAFTRMDTIVGLGGGALTDIAAFAASSYLRGIKLLLIPSTLLAQVDASIGGKTAINLDSAKNLAGSFYFPDAVIVDPELLSTLSERELKSGMGEIIKYAYIEDTVADYAEYKKGPRSLRAAIAENFRSAFSVDNPFLLPLISICIRMKLSVVLKDPREENLRRCLNLGHTLGHGLEKCSQYQISHGESVAIGTAFAFRVAQRKNLISESEYFSVLADLQALSLDYKIPSNLDRERLIEAMLHDKKRSAASIKFVVPVQKAGRVNFDMEMPVEELAEFVRTDA